MLKGGRRAWSAVLAVVALGVLALASCMYARSEFGALAGIASGSMVVHMDFDVFWHSARALWEGRSLYYDTGGPDSSTNPPFWTLLISPLGLLEPLTAYRSLVLITVLASVVSLPWLEPVAYVLGVGIVILTAFKARLGSEAGLWALVAASLIASPIAWHNYLLLLGPGILLLLARGRVALALLLLALQFIPPQ